MVQTKMVQTKWWCWPDGTGTINQWTIETGPTSRFGSSKQKLISDIVATLIYITPKFQSSAIVTNRHKKIRKDTDTKRYKKTRKDTKRYDFAQPLFWDFLTISYHSCDSNSQKWQFLRDHGGPDPPPPKKILGGSGNFFLEKKIQEFAKKGMRPIRYSRIEPIAKTMVVKSRSEKRVVQWYLVIVAPKPQVAKTSNIVGIIWSIT